jgi:hypothetical protein
MRNSVFDDFVKSFDGIRIVGVAIAFDVFFVRLE